MNKQEIIDYLKGQTEWSGNPHYILVNKSELISMIEDLDELEFKNYLRDIKSQIDYLRIQGPGKVKSLRMLENMVDNMLTGYWSSTSIRTEKVKVPAFVAEWIKKHCYMGKHVCLERFMCQYNNVELPTDLYNYYDSDKDGARDKVISAILDGYEVEEEPKWIVRVGEKLLFKEYDDNEFPVFVIDDKPGSIQLAENFDLERKAHNVQKEVGGKVEKV